MRCATNVRRATGSGGARSHALSSPGARGYRWALENRRVDGTRESRTGRSPGRDGPDKRLWAPRSLLSRKYRAKRVTTLALSRVSSRADDHCMSRRARRAPHAHGASSRDSGCLRLSRPEGPPTRPGSRDGSPRSPGGPPLKRHPARASDRARDRRPRPRQDCEPAFVRGARSCAERIALLALHPSRPARIGGRLEACLPRAPNPDAPPRTGPAKKKARRVRPKNRR